jgi:glutamyl-tRNA reductase
VNNLDGVYLYDIDSLQAIADHSLGVRQQEVTVCEQMIERHATEFGAWLSGGWQQSVAYSQVASGGTTEGAKS